MTTLYARFSPPGRSAVSVIAVHGPEAWEIITRTFRRRGNRPLPSSPKPESMFLGWFGPPKAADEVVFSVVASDRLEIHGHGGPEAIRLIETALAEQGAAPASWQQIDSLTEAEWRIDASEVLSRADTVRTAAIALDQWNGAFHRAIEEIKTLRQAGNIEEARRREERLRSLEDVGNHLVERWKIVLAGPPNVGKSSLINALVGYERSVVSPWAGTTRDIVISNAALDGWPVKFADTAGLHEEGDALEREGMSRARRTIKEADLVVWVVDASQPGEISFDKTLAKRSIVAANKSDLPRRQELRPDWIPVSATTREGVDALVVEIVGRLVPSPPEPGEAVPLPGWLALLNGT